jgi:hypothetical protein
MDISRSPLEIFLHVRVMIGVIVGLSIARLLTGIARFIQHPKQNQVYLVHLGWVLAVLPLGNPFMVVGITIALRLGYVR